jgi:hypothetical protein
MKKIKQSHREMLKLFKDNLIDLAHRQYNKVMPEINLIVEVMVEGIKDCDHDYLNSNEFSYHCYLLRVRQDKIKRMALLMVTFIELNILFESPKKGELSGYFD